MSKHKPNAGFARTDRIADEIQQELAGLIQLRVKDPRLPAMISITQVKVSKDLAYADVYVTSLQALVGADGGESSAKMDELVKNCEAILAKAAGFLRTELSQAIKLRHMPKLRFHYDRTSEKGQQMDSLIAQARATDPNSLDDEAGEGQS